MKTKNAYALIRYATSLLTVFASAHAFAESDCNVQVDCATHIISVKGTLSRIDCGKPGHPSVDGTGTIGGLHNGPIVHNGVEIVNFPGMGPSGGGKVFHCSPQNCEGGCPKGLNDSNGCIHVCPATLQVLKTCQGSNLTITGVGQGPFQPSQRQLASMPALVQQQEYRGTNDDSYPPLNTLQPGAVSGSDGFGDLLRAIGVGISGAGR